MHVCVRVLVMHVCLCQNAHIWRDVEFAGECEHAHAEARATRVTQTPASGYQVGSNISGGAGQSLQGQVQSKPKSPGHPSPC